MIIAGLVFVGLLVITAVYIGYIRPMLEARKWVRPFPADVETFRQRVCEHIKSSATMAWSYLVINGGVAIELASKIDKEDVRQALQAIHLGEYFGLALIVIGGVTLVARLRTLPR